MPFWPQFVGGAYRARSESIAADACINLYPEITESAESVKKSALYGTPGMKLLQMVTTAPCRGAFSQDDRSFAVLGDTLYEVNITQATATAISGTILNDGNPVSFASNGRGGEQLAIVGGGALFIFNFVTNVLTGPIGLPLTNDALIVVFINGYFVLQEMASVRRWFSALEDGTSWDALDFFATSQTSDDGVGLIAVHDRLWCFGSQTASIYYDSGDALTPFQPYPGTVIHEGATSPWSIILQGENVFWLAQDNLGRGRIVMADGSGGQPVPISTAPISFAISGYARINDCEALAYEQEGHPFVAFTFPTGDQTWVWDTREQMWHQRDQFDEITGVSHRWRARGCAVQGVEIMVGDYETGGLYTLSLDTFVDACGPIRRLRRAPYLSSENQWIFLDRFELGIQAGIGLITGQGSDPQLMLRVSRDSGATWTPPVVASMGAIGDYLARPAWTRLGRVRADRLVIEVTQTDPVRTVWGPGAWIRALPGTGQL